MSPALARGLHDRALYAYGLALYDAGLSFESHELWEDLWLRNRSPARPFLQGLIQLAAGRVHLAAGRKAPAASLFGSARARLAAYPARYLGLDLAALLAELAPEAPRAPARLAWAWPSLSAFWPHRGRVEPTGLGHSWFWPEPAAAIARRMGLDIHGSMEAFLATPEETGS